MNNLDWKELPEANTLHAPGLQVKETLRVGGVQTPINISTTRSQLNRRSLIKLSKGGMFGLSLVLTTGVSYIAGAIAAGNGSMSSADTLTWEKFGDSLIKVAKLWGDRDKGAYGMLIKLPPGFKAGVHAHPAEYNGINLTGTWVHTMNGETKELPPGSHVMQPAGQFHDDACKRPEEYSLLIQQDAKGDFIPEKKQ